MNIEKEIQRIRQLIIRSVHTPLSLTEQQELDTWRAISPGNEDLYRKLTMQEFSEEDWIRYRRARDTDDWFMLRKKIGIRGKRKFYLKMFLRCAAILVVGVVAVYLLQRPSGMVVEQEVVVAQQLTLPGEGKTTLELEDGELIVLGQNDTTQGKRLSEWGIYQGKTSLVYGGGDSLKSKNHVLRTPKDCEYVLTLADGTKVWINSDSELRYPVAFDEEQRVVQLIKGEAYFEVTPDKRRPFIVVSEQLTTRVLGTAFNVRSSSDKNVDVTLVNGSVVVRENRNSKEVVLKPGENVALVDNELKVRHVDIFEYTAWKDGYFYYNNVRLEDIFNELGGWFGFSVVFEDENMKDCRFKFWANRQDTMEQVLERWNETGSLSVQLNGRCVTISDK